MSRIDEIANHSIESEKALERYLVEQVKRLGGLCLKYDNPHEVGYPDRIVVLRNRSAFWVEVKSKGMPPRPIQRVRIFALRQLGQKVYVVDNRGQVNDILGIEK